jgi:hypothetical protein
MAGTGAGAGGDEVTTPCVYVGLHLHDKHGGARTRPPSLAAGVAFTRDRG